MRKKVSKMSNRELKEKHPILKVRSEFSTMKISGGGVHKSKKDYDRKSGKKEISKFFKDGW